MRVLTKRLRLESRDFRCTSAICVFFKFDDKNTFNPFEFQEYFPIRLRPKLNWRLGLALFAARFRSYWDL